MLFRSVCGSTFGENISYPDYEKFSVMDMGGDLRVYDPIRITIDEYTNRNNDRIMAMNDKVENAILKEVDVYMNKYYQKPTFEVKLPEGMMQPLGPTPEQMAEMQKNMPTPTINGNGNGKKSNNPNLIPALMSEAGVSPEPLKSVAGFKTKK